MPVKRLNYYNGQFLKEKDFKDEQSYHINALSMHNRNLHSWGIASGLDVSLDKPKKHIILNEGMAVDRAGRQIILDKPVKIDPSNASVSTVYLTVSLRITETDPVKEDEFSGNTRISEEPVIQLDESMPDEKSMNIFLAEITLNPENKTVLGINKSRRKIIGLTDDISVNSISFNVRGKEKPVIKGIEGKDNDLEIRSGSTRLTGDVSVAGSLVASRIGGSLDKNIVGINQIMNESISVSKIKSHKNIVTVEGTMEPLEEKIVALEESSTHLFLITSVIPTTNGQIDWKWQTEYERNKLSYKLILKNVSNKKLKYDVRYFDISE